MILQRGSILLMTLTFVAMFLIIFISLAGLVGRTHKESVLQAQDETAFQIAEAGLNYGRWRLAHDPENYASVSSTVNDQFAGDLGTYDVTFTPPVAGSSAVTISSVGETAVQPLRQVTLEASYGRPSLARYASITNGDVWYGGTIFGATHANGGIRMDGVSDGLVSSAKETYPCQPIHACNSPYETKPGVWGTGIIQELWEYPAQAVDYNALTADLLDIKDAAIVADTYYGDSDAYGYELVFNNNNTYSISEVTGLGPKVWSWLPDTGWQYISHDVGSTALLETKTVPAGGVIFVEDMTWVHGDIQDRITLAAGVFPDTTSTNVDIIINGNISYDGVTTGSRSFAAIAQRHILLPWSGAPDNLVLDGAFVAQKGSFHRRHYPNCCGAEAHRLKTAMTRYGMMASNGIPSTAWLSGGAITSGYQSGQSTYDSYFLYAPPPYFPVNGEYQFISWEEKQ